MPSLFSTNSKILVWVLAAVTFSLIPLSEQRFQNPLWDRVKHVKEMLSENVNKVLHDGVDQLLENKEIVELIDEQNYQEILENLHSNNLQTALTMLKQRQILRDDDHPVRPIYGMIGEPFRVSQLVGNQDIDKNQYIPWAHVMFLRQTSLKIFPINYEIELDLMEHFFDNMNGLYLHGDGTESYDDYLYEETFEFIYDYAKKRNTADEEHFPVFLFGNHMRNLVKLHLRSDRYILEADEIFGEQLKLRVLHDNTDETFFGGNFTHNEIKQKLESGLFFNRQEYGMTHSEFIRHYELRNNYDIWATFETQSDYVHEWIAIVAHKSFPFYLFTYNPEFNLFIFPDKSITSADPIDRSDEAREHVQFLGNEIWEEGQKSHVISEYDDTIDEEEIGFITFVSSFDRNKMPKGFKFQEVYFIY